VLWVESAPPSLTDAVLVLFFLWQVLNELADTLVGIDKEIKRLQRDLKKAQGGMIKDKVAEDTAEVRDLRAALQQAEERVAATQLAQEEAERAFSRLHQQPLGEDRNRNMYWYFEGEPRLYVHMRNPSTTAITPPPGANRKMEAPVERRPGGCWAIYWNEVQIKAVLSGLQSRGLREGPLVQSLTAVSRSLTDAFRSVGRCGHPRPRPAHALAARPELVGESGPSSLSGGRDGSDSEATSTPMDVDDVASFSSPTVQEPPGSGSGGEDSVAQALPVKSSDSLEGSRRSKRDRKPTLRVREEADEPIEQPSEPTPVPTRTAWDVTAELMVVEPAMTEEEEQAEMALVAAAAAEQGKEVKKARRPTDLGPKSYAPLKDPWKVGFSVIGNTLVCFRTELLVLDDEISTRIAGTSVIAMCPLAATEHRTKWRRSVQEASHVLQLSQPLLDLEEYLAQALGYQVVLDEALRLYEAIKDGQMALRRRRESGEKISRNENVIIEGGQVMVVARGANAMKREEGEPLDTADANSLVGSLVDSMEVDEEEEDGITPMDDAEGGAANGSKVGDDASDSSSDEEEPEEEEQEQEVAVAPVVRKRKPKKPPHSMQPKKRKRRKPSLRRVSSTTAATEEADEDDLEKREAALASQLNEALVRQEMTMLEGPRSRETRDAWRSEVQACRTTSSLALCLYALVRCAPSLLQKLDLRVADIKKREAVAEEALQADAENGELSIPTREELEVVWVANSKGDREQWPAMVHRPYNRKLARLLAKKGHRLVRIIGETRLFHLKNEGETISPFVDDDPRFGQPLNGKNKVLWSRSLQAAQELFRMQKESQAQAQQAGGEKAAEDALDEDSTTESEDEGASGRASSAAAARPAATMRKKARNNASSSASAGAPSREMPLRGQRKQ
jgi:hypothetical protein